MKRKGVFLILYDFLTKKAIKTQKTQAGEPCHLPAYDYYMAPSIIRLIGIEDIIDNFGR